MFKFIFESFEIKQKLKSLTLLQFSNENHNIKSFRHLVVVIISKYFLFVSRFSIV